MREEYDLIISIGQACLSTQVLRICNLQKFSYPFDWLYGSEFSKRVEILTSKFDNFLEIGDLEYIGNRLEPEPCDIYRNKSNQIIFKHDFPINIPISESFDAVCNKYNRRIKRLLKLIDKSKNVLCVYIENPDEKNDSVSRQDLLDAEDKLKFSFPSTNIDILCFSCHKNQETTIEEVSESSTKISLDYRSSKDEESSHIANYMLLVGILKDRKIKLKENSIIEFKKLKRGFGIYFFKKMFNILRIQTLILGLRFDFCIGKVRD